MIKNHTHNNDQVMSDYWLLFFTWRKFSHWSILPMIFHPIFPPDPSTNGKPAQLWWISHTCTQTAPAGTHNRRWAWRSGRWWSHADCSWSSVTPAGQSSYYLYWSTPAKINRSCQNENTIGFKYLYNSRKSDHIIIFIIIILMCK